MNIENSKIINCTNLFLTCQKQIKETQIKMLLFKTSLSISHGKFYDKSIITINSKVIVPFWNDEFELPDNSYSSSDIQDYIKYIKTLNINY